MTAATATADRIAPPTKDGPEGLTRAQIKAILRRPIGEFTADEARAYLDALEREDARNREALVTGLTGATAAIHIVIGGKLFVLNGLGFLALLGARRLLPKNEAWQSLARDSLIGYTGLTVGAYFVKYGYAGFENITGLGTKLVELALLRVLWADRQAAQKRLQTVIDRAAAA